MKSNPYYRTGWAFPPTLTDSGGQMQIITFEEDIRESLQILFTTLPGERVGHPLYGCDLLQYMYRPINNSLLSEIKNTISTAITLFEVRIDLVEVRILPRGTLPFQLDIHISYRQRETSSRYNITLPFFLQEP